MANEVPTTHKDTQTKLYTLRWQGSRAAVVVPLVLLTAIASLVLLLQRTSIPDTQPPIVIKDARLRELSVTSRKANEWLAAWQHAGADVGYDDFTAVGQTTYVPVPSSTRPTVESLLPPVATRYEWSPNQRRYVNLLTKRPVPTDANVTVFNRDGREAVELLAACQGGCSADAAAWLDNDRVVIAGTAACDDADESCRRLTLSFYDFAKNEVTRYRSATFEHDTDPFIAQKLQRWEESSAMVDPDAFPNIRIAWPRDRGTVGKKFTVTGKSRTFEGTVHVRLVNMRTSRVLLDTHTLAFDITDDYVGTFKVDVTLPMQHVESNDSLLLEAYEISANDGSEIHETRYYVRYVP